MQNGFETILLVGILLVLLMIWRFGPGGLPAPVVPTKLNLAVATMMRKPVDLTLWLEHHRKKGIRRFYIRLEDSPGVASFLRLCRDVYFEEGVSGEVNNYTTQVDRQRDFVNSVLPKAREEGMDWVFHIDADELLEGDLDGTLAVLPASTLIGKLKNAEAVYKDEEPTCFSAKKFIRCDKGGPCTAYVNGKGVGRPVEGVALGGAHDFVYQGKVDDAVTAQIDFDSIHVLHYDSCTVGTWLEKFKHMSKNAKMDDIVFPYYHKSIEAAKTAVGVYKEHKMREDISPEWTHIKKQDEEAAKPIM